MCLDVVYRGKQKKEALAKLPESGYYWKVVYLEDGEYWPEIYDDTPYKVGWNVTQREYEQEYYVVAYHLFKHKEDAIVWFDCGRMIRCKVDKKDIINIGIQKYIGEDLLVIVTTRFWCPKPRRKEC